MSPVIQCGSRKDAVHILLGLDGSVSERIAVVREGFPEHLLSRVADALGWNTRTLRDCIRKEVRRGRRGASGVQRLGTWESERLLRLVDMIDDVERMVASADNIDGFVSSVWLGQWLVRSCPALGGERPAEYLVDTLEGIALLRQLISQMESGAYA